MLTGPELVFALLIVAAGAVAMGTVGFGLGMVATPVLLLFLDVKSAVVVVNFLIALLLAMVLTRTWRHLDLKLSGGLVLGGVAATPVGVFALNVADAGVLKLVIVGAVITLGLFSLTGLQLPLANHRLSGPVFGFVTCLAITSISIGGPLAGLYAITQRWPTQTVRASLALLFIASSTAAVAQYAAAGLLDRTDLANVGLLVPGLIAGFAIASMVVNRLDERAFRYVAVGITLMGGAVLLTRELSAS